AAMYNRLILAAYDDYVDFINFHYRTGRTDTEFWRDYQRPDAMTPANQARLESWRYTFPVTEDFAPKYTDIATLTTNLVIWAPMLCAFGLLRPEAARRVVQLSRNAPQLKANVDRYLQVCNHFSRHGLTQAEAIAYFRGLP